MDKHPSNPGTERLVKLMTAADFVFFLIGAAAIVYLLNDDLVMDNKIIYFILFGLIMLNSMFRIGYRYWRRGRRG